MTFPAKLDACVSKNNSLLCVGLDPDRDKLPKHLLDETAPYFVFNKAIIDATADLVCAFKPNSAFYEAQGAAGIEELALTCSYIREQYPHVPIILDFKRGDIGNTNRYSALFAFEHLGADAVTVQAYQGGDALEPYFEYKDKGIIILCRFSNPGAGEFQDLEVKGRKLFLYVAERVTKHWNKNGNCHLMVGATFPQEMAEARQVISDDMIILSPGKGAQGADAGASVKAGVNSKGRGLIINSSREVLYASSGKDFAEAARQKAKSARDVINKYRGGRT